MDKKDQNQEDGRDLIELASDVAELVKEARMALKRGEAQEKVKQYLFTYYSIGKKGSFEDDEGEKHEFIIPSLLTRFLIRKISFGKTLWYNDVISCVVRKIWGDEKARTILLRTLGRRKLPSNCNDKEAIEWYEALHRSLSRNKAKDIEKRESSFWQRMTARACIWDYIRTIR